MSADFEREFAAYVGAKYAIACTNGTTTLEVALRCVTRPGARIATSPLTMAATSAAIVNVGCVPVYEDVDARTWLTGSVQMPVSLYGLHAPRAASTLVDDAAQTLRPHDNYAFTSYSLQRSKILNTGEGGVLVTNNEELATRARSFSSLGYDLSPSSARIDKALIKRPDHVRHVRIASNCRMNDVTAALGLKQLERADELKAIRQRSAALMRNAHVGCDWIQPQFVPEGSTHDYWAYTVALSDASLWQPLSDLIVTHGGERPFGAWRLTYTEPAFAHLRPVHALPNAESLQPRLMQFQTNNVDSAERNAVALHNAITKLSRTN